MTNEAIKTLAEMKRLKGVELIHTHVTSEGQKELENAIPGVAVKASLGGPARSEPRRALPVVLVLVLVIAVAFAGVSLYMRLQRQARARSQMAPGGEDGKGASTPAASLIGLKCPGCGQNLKVRAELAGKNVVCPKCRQTVLVPAIKVAGT